MRASERARACWSWLQAFPRRFGEVCALTPSLNLNISKRLHWHNPGVSSFFLEVDLPCMKLRGGCYCREFVSQRAAWFLAPSLFFFFLVIEAMRKKRERGRFWSPELSIGATRRQCSSVLQRLLVLPPPLLLYVVFFHLFTEALSSPLLFTISRITVVSKVSK